MPSSFRRIGQSLRGSWSLTLITINTIIHSLPIYALALCKLMPLSDAWRKRIRHRLAGFAESWIAVNNRILGRYRKLHWDVRLPDSLDRAKNYFVNANHQSWVDILVLQRTFNRKIPFLRFFLKQELIWVPFLGAAWWALDFPFMRRYSRTQMEARPELKQKDLESTQQMCERLAGVPVSIMNFLEGTRFNQSKQVQQESPFTNLLRPKAGGLAFTLTTLREQISSMLDVSIVYSDGQPSLWDLMCGRLKRIVVDVREVTIPDWIVEGDYQGDAVYREKLKNWINQWWVEKDLILSDLKAAQAHR